MNIIEIKAIMPEIILAVSALLLLLLGAFRGDKKVKSQIDLALVAVFIAICAEINISAISGNFLSGMIYIDKFSFVAKLLVLVSTFGVLFLSRSYYVKHVQTAVAEFPVLILLSVVGMMLLLSAANLLALYVSFELQSLALYILAALHRNNTKSSEAGLKYFVLGSLASGLLLFGSSYLYGFTGSMDFNLIASSIGENFVNDPKNLGILIGMILIVVAICFKISAVPFHMWAPDVYQGAPTIVTSFFVTAPKVTLIALFIKLLMGPFAFAFASLQQIIFVLAMLSMLVGAIGGLLQFNIKRLLAYSSIGHVGYILMGLVAGKENFGFVLIYITIYLLMTLGVFAFIMLLKKDNNANVDSDPEDIRSLSGLAKNHPLSALALSILLFSMAGIPPFAGFIGKFFVFMAVVGQGYYLLALVGILASVIAAFYYLRIIKIMYFDENKKLVALPANFEARTILFSSAFICLVLFIWFKPLLELASWTF